jgi:hypothetical protein
MSKRHRNVAGPGHFKVQGHRVEDKDAAKMSKQALDREAARRKARPKRKRVVAAGKRRAPVVPRAQPPHAPDVLARAHDREFARMNEQRRAKRIKAANGNGNGHPRYFSDAARGVIRQVARMALAPLSLARAVVDRIRDRDRD